MWKIESVWDVIELIKAIGFFAMVIVGLFSPWWPLSLSLILGFIYLFIYSKIKDKFDRPIEPEVIGLLGIITAGIIWLVYDLVCCKVSF